MRNDLRRAAAILLFIVSLLEINCAGGGQGATVTQNENTVAANQGGANQLAVPPSKTVAPLVELFAPPDAKANAPLEIHWKISNPNRELVFVYSALLEKTAAQFVEVEIDAARKTVEIRFTRAAQIALEPNFFPKAAFVKIESGKSIEGDFKLAKIPAGEWSVTASVGYGNEIESVRKRADLAKGEHPINTIVGWQTLAVSNPVQIRVK